MKTLQSIVALALLAGATSFAISGCASHDHFAQTHSASAGSYPLTKCVVSSEDLGDKPYVFTHNGQTVKLCCEDCLAKFNKDPEKYMAKINAPK